MTVRTQASLGKGLKEVDKDDFNMNNLFLATITKVNYKYQTVELRTKFTYAGRSVGTKGEFSAPFPKSFIGKTPEGALFGDNNIIVPGSIALVGFLEGDSGKPFIINVYGAPDDNKMLTPNPIESGDIGNRDIYKYGSMIHQITPSLTYNYLDGEGTSIKSFNGKTFLSITSQEDERPLATDFYTGTEYEDLYTSYYGDGSLVEPRNQVAPNVLLKHRGEFTHDGEEDNHVTTLHITEAGAVRVSVMNTETQERTTQEMDENGNYRVIYQGDELLLDEAQVWVEYGINKETKSFYIKNENQEFEFTDKGVLINGTPLIDNLEGSLQEAFEKLKSIQKDLEDINSLLEGAGKENLEELIRTAKDSIEASGKASSDVEKLRGDISTVSGRVEGNIKKLDDYMKTMQEFVDDTNDFITEYSGSLDNIKDDINDITDTETKYRHTTYSDIKIHADLPFKFPGYEQVVSDNNAKYYFPQGIALDDDYIYIVERAPETGRKSLIVVYDRLGNYITKFYAGSTGGEGIHVEKEGGKRYAYIRTTSNNLGKFDITTLDSSIDGTILQPEIDFNLNMFMNFFRTKEGWAIEANNQTKGIYLQRDTLVFYNHDFSKRLGYLWIPPSNSTLWSNDLYGSISNYSAKKQGMTMIGNTIIQTMGGNWLPSRDKELHTYHMQGIQEISPSGQIMNDYTYPPTELKAYLEGKGNRVAMIEHEGAYNYNNRLFTLIVYTNRAYAESNKQGVMLVEYKPKEKDYTFNEAGIPFNAPTANYNPYKTNIDNKLVNEYNGEEITGIKALAKYMIDTFQDKVVFYTSKITGFKDFNDANYPTGIKIELENLNNATFQLREVGLYEEKFYVLSYSRTTDTFSLYPRNKDVTRSNIDLLSIDYKEEGYFINSTNTPEEVSKDGWVKTRMYGTNGRIEYQPVDSYDTYINIKNNNQWQGWKKITTVE